MDLTQKESLCEDISESKKCCTDCKTTKTPLWRGGPAGPKTLCNACGIRERKKRAVMGLRKASEMKKEKPNGISASSNSATSNSSENSLSKSLKMGLMVLGKEVVLLQRQRSSIVRRQRRRREIGEEEQAAVLLMALSCGSVFA